jgi:hypothetical protein
MTPADEKVRRLLKDPVRFKFDPPGTTHRTSVVPVYGRLDMRSGYEGYHTAFSQESSVYRSGFLRSFISWLMRSALA